MNRRKPTRISLNITEKCNLTCSHCFSDSGEKSKKDGLIIEEIYSLIDQMKEMECEYVAIGGGEPFVRKDLFDILEYAYKKCIQSSVVTNCTLINKEKAEKLNNLEVKKIKVSLDGMEKNHDKVRGAGMFKKTIKKIKLLRKHFTKEIQVGFTVNSENIKDCKKIIKLAANLKVNSLRLAPILPFGRALKNKSLLLSQKQFLNFIKEAKKVNSAIEIDFPDRTRVTRENKGFGCHCGKEVCWILANGDFYSCIFLGKNFKLGNIKRSSLKELWKKSKKVSALSGNKVCNSCFNYRECRGGCRARALYTYNDVNAIDPFCPLKKNETTIPSINNSI